MSDTDYQVIPIHQLQPNPLQPREKIKKEELDELVSSIRTYGILEPLVVAHTPAGYQIIAGERRWRAAQLAGVTEVPAVIKETTPKGMLEMALIENVQRVDLSPIERAQAFLQLVRDFQFSYDQIAERIGKSNAYVSNTLNLLRLPDAVKDGLVGNVISEGHARALLGLEDKKVMVEVYKDVLQQHASVRQTEELVRKAKLQSGQGMTKRNPSGRLVENPQIDAWRTSLKQVFSEKSQVKLKRSARQTMITFIFSGDLDSTQADLEKVLKLAELSK